MSAFGPERANPRDLPGSLIGICGALVAIGIASFAYGLSTDPDTAWRAYHVNFIYFATLAQGGLCLACAIVIIDANWPGPIRHVAEGLAAWVPISFALLAIGYFGRESIHTNWIHGAPMGKEGWLTIPRVYITDLAILFVLSVLSIRFLKLSVRPALKGAAERAPRAKGMFARWSANWRGDDVELSESARKAAGARADHRAHLRVRLHGRRLRPGHVTHTDLVLDDVRLVFRLERLPVGDRDDDSHLRAASQRAGLGGRAHQGPLSRSRQDAVRVLDLLDVPVLLAVHRDLVREPPRRNPVLRTSPRFAISSGHLVPSHTSTSRSPTWQPR